MEASEGMAIRRRSNWNVVCGDLESVLDLILDDGSGQSHPASTSVVLEAAPDSGSCEISVEFHEQSCRVQSISIISSARQCEVYSLLEPRGDAEYVGTARGELHDEAAEELSSGALYEAEVELVDSDPWAGLKVRLLSLVNRSRVNLKKLTIVAAAGPAVSREEDNGSFNNSSSLLTMMMPSVLSMLRGMPNRNHQIETNLTKAREVVSGIQEDVSSSSPAATMQQQAAVERRDEDNCFRSEVMSKLQGLETAVGSLESFLREAFRKVDVRLETLEAQVYGLQAQKAAFERVDERLEALESRVSELCVQTSPAADVTGLAANETDRDASSSQISDAADEAGDVELPLKSSISLENAWYSSLAAFSTALSSEPVEADTQVEPDQIKPTSSGISAGLADIKVEPGETEDETEAQDLLPAEDQVEANEGDVARAEVDEVSGSVVHQGDDIVMSSGAPVADKYDLIDWWALEDAVAIPAAAPEAQTLNDSVFSLIDLPAEAGLDHDV